MAKGKNILHHCVHCERMTKMEMIGAVENQPEKTWYRCTRCRHATLVDLEALKQSLQDAKKKLDKSQCLEYKPENTYSVGEAIFQLPLSYVISVNGIIMWLIIVVVLSMISSFLPAYNASRLTVREILAYE